MILESKLWMFLKFCWVSPEDNHWGIKLGDKMLLSELTDKSFLLELEAAQDFHGP